MDKEREISSEEDYLRHCLRMAFERGWMSVIDSSHGSHCNIVMGITRGEQEVKRLTALQTAALAMLEKGLPLELAVAILTNHCLDVPLDRICENILEECSALRQAREHHYAGLGKTHELCGAFEGMIQDAKQEVIETVKANIEVWRDHRG